MSTKSIFEFSMQEQRGHPRMLHVDIRIWWKDHVISSMKSHWSDHKRGNVWHSLNLHLHPTQTEEMWKVGQKIISNPGVISHPVSNLFSNPIRSGYILIIWMILLVSVYSINQTGISETKVSRRREILTFRFLAKWVIFHVEFWE